MTKRRKNEGIFIKQFISDLKKEFHGYNPKKFTNDLMAGLTVAAVALPLALAFGVSSGADADTVQEMVRQPAKAIKARKPVPEHRDRDPRAVSCHCIEDCQREDLQTSTAKILLLSA